MVLLVFLAWELRGRGGPRAAVRVDRRPVTIALFVGFVIAFAQVVPMSQLPLYFGIAMGYGPVFGMVALAPLFLGLVAAGPIAGFLLVRYEPRHLIAGGVLVVGVGDLALAALLGPRAPYVGFVGPLLLVGGGFVVATTVRTAIIFASVPRGMPATAAALNEASIEVGTHAGLVVVTGLLAATSVAIYSASLAGLTRRRGGVPSPGSRRRSRRSGTPVVRVASWRPSTRRTSRRISTPGSAGSASCSWAAACSRSAARR